MIGFFVRKVRVIGVGGKLGRIWKIGGVGVSVRSFFIEVFFRFAFVVFGRDFGGLVIVSVGGR